MAHINVTRSKDVATTTNAAHAETIALALMGKCALRDSDFLESVSWDRSSGPCAVGFEAVTSAQKHAAPPVSIHIDQIVTQGKAATVSGRLTRDGIGTMLFCHILRKTAAQNGKISQIVSFEHQEVQRKP